jgi:hypothetical protein
MKVEALKQFMMSQGTYRLFRPYPSSLKKERRAAVGWLVGWLIGWLVGWLIGWLVG